MGRTITFNLKSDEGFSIDGLLIDFAKQKILGTYKGKVFDLPTKSTVEFSRQRHNKNKKNKSIFKAPNAIGELFLDPNSAILGFDHIFAVDTNTKSLGGSKASVACVLHVLPKGVNSQSAYFECVTLLLIEFWNVNDKPENFAWMVFLNTLENNRNKFAGKIALVVDSDFDEHEAFNNRSKPVYANRYLPEDVSVVYATDRAPGNLASEMIRYCDKTANEVFNNENLLLNPNGFIKLDDMENVYLRSWDTDVDVENFKDFFIRRYPNKSKGYNNAIIRNK